ncbi:uncharacterized protein FOMMEDRAFT_18771 [Fomitiporia mediterranea MF3/22]|uniref:uncharacterized protein n=1 Tax=Fomitiporia mediterranea (strain MF3/22) TaxID=694068 RepID=UPI00044075AC|nr:uncharacterized protein FOMMEDRAFT_18771 [Fomitiporia mediterranea MF3/22]EJD05135.1 hypothetical protein FOMMEDRAFT_18771 [Fomitiporia mediterranea MF3/22]
MSSPSPDPYFVRFQWKTYSDAALARLVLDKCFPISLFEEVLSVVLDPGFKPHDVTFKHAHCIFDQVAAFGRNLAVEHDVSAPSDSDSVRAQTDGHSTVENSAKAALTVPQPSNSGSLEGASPVFVSADASGQTTSHDSALDQSDDQTGAFAARNTLTDPTTNAHDRSISPVVMGFADSLSSVFSEKDANAPSTKQCNNTISPYCETSFEGVRRQDYAQGREPTGGVGQTKAFGLAPSPSSNAACDQTVARFGGLFPPKNQQSFGNIYEGQTTTAGCGSVPPATTGTMPSYRGTSREELRFQDYTQGRKPTSDISQSKTSQLAPSQSTFAPFGKITANAKTSRAFGWNGQRTSTQSSTTFGPLGHPLPNHGLVQGTGTGTGTGDVVSVSVEQGAPQQQTKNTDLPGRSDGRVPLFSNRENLKKAISEQLEIQLRRLMTQPPTSASLGQFGQNDQPQQQDQLQNRTPNQQQ